jgi:hypothetical protein
LNLARCRCGSYRVDEHGVHSLFGIDFETVDPAPSVLTKALERPARCDAFARGAARLLQATERRPGVNLYVERAATDERQQSATCAVRIVHVHEIVVGRRQCDRERRPAAVA